MSLPVSHTFEKTKSTNIGLSGQNPALSTFTAEQQRFAVKNSHTDFIRLDTYP
jgi:hypothetical protein